MKKDKTLKIALILAAHNNDPIKGNLPFMPLSLPILAASAPEHNYTFIDMLARENIDQIEEDTDVIGISLRQSSEKAAYQIADHFLSKGKTVILGGAQASAVPHRAKQHATSVVVGEAEELWPILLKDLQNKKLKEFYVSLPHSFDNKGKSCYQSENLPSLKNLPIPIRKHFKNNYIFDLTYASKGCPINCDFCLVSNLYGKKMRFRPIDEVVNEIKQFKGFYYLLDETIFGRKNCYDYYLELYDKLIDLPKKKYWTGQANLDAASDPKGREVIKKAAKAGLSYVAIGIESINESTLKSSGAYAKMGIKNSSEYIQKMKENIAFIKSQGIFISGWFTIGYETDTIQTFYDSLKFCEETQILPVFTPIRALDGTRLSKRIKDEGRLQDITKHISNIKHPVLTDKEMVDALTNTVNQGYTKSINRKRLIHFFIVLLKGKIKYRDFIYKFMFAYHTQKNMKKLVKMENQLLIDRVENNI